ncbi:MAG: KH domain-containing protein [Clostridia bacterium]|nr:KH domain-containing protein [Clostridia bacterium]
MIKEAFGTGATLDEAKDAALKALAAPEDADVRYDVIERPKAKVLGIFGGSPAKMRAYYEYEEDPFAKAKEYVLNILKNLGVDEAEISVEADEEEVRFSISCGDDYGSVIGRRGETLDAIQYLTRLVINRGSEEYKRVSINVGNYREKRESTLRALAHKNAAKVRKYGRNVVLEPMNPYERRIIHTTVQEIEGVTSHSVGSDSDRKVVITLEEGVKPTHGGGYNNRGRGGYNKGGNRGGYRGGNNRGGNRRYNDDAPAAPSRAPRSDSAGASLYGKIEINK